MMNKFSLLLILGLVLLLINTGCDDKRPNYQKAIVTDAVLVANTGCSGGAVKLLQVDTGASVIYWKGTEFGGRGKHEGTIQLANGLVELCDSTLTGGWFTVDMRAIYITDVPSHETIARKNLQDHLMSDDFFAVKEYPTAVFQITAVKQTTIDSARISGDLTIRGVTHNITFKAALPVQTAQQVKASAQFSIFRKLWNVNYVGSELTSDLVDDEIYFDVHLSAHN